MSDRFNRRQASIPPPTMSMPPPPPPAAPARGLTRDQEIRARAAEIVYPAGPSYPVVDEGVFPTLTREVVYDEIEAMAAYITDGSKP